jgi:hypothetical protein
MFMCMAGECSVIPWLEIILFTIFAPASIVFIFVLIDRITGKKWPFHDRNKKKVNSGAKFG